MPRPLVVAWSCTLVLGAGCGLVGLLRPNLRRVEIAGLLWLGTAALVYGVVLLARFRAGGVVAAGIVLGFALAALVRALAVYVTYEVAWRVAPPPPRRGP